MGGGISREILPGLFIGDANVARQRDLLRLHAITHVVAVNEHAKPLHEDLEYLCIRIADSTLCDIELYFSTCNTFVHKARAVGGRVLIHCLAGCSRSVALATCYVMCATTLDANASLDAIRAAHPTANPNSGFRAKLRKFAESGDDLARERLRLSRLSCTGALSDADERHARQLYERQQEFIRTGIPADGVVDRLVMSDDRTKKRHVSPCPSSTMRLPSTPIVGSELATSSLFVPVGRRANADSVLSINAMASASQSQIAALRTAGSDEADDDDDDASSSSPPTAAAAALQVLSDSGETEHVDDVFVVEDESGQAIS